MKRSFLMLLGVGITLALFVTPVFADDAEAAVSLEAEAEVSTCDISVADTENPGCYAEQDCPYDVPVSCSGNQQCAVYPFAVQCDLKWYHCQCAAAPAWCDDPGCYCQCKEGGSSDAWCRKECCMEWP